jgi:hypothetical protein
VNQHLTSLTMSAKAEDRPEQKAAVERLTAVVGGAQTVIGQITAAGDDEETNVQIFTMLSTQRAIWTYWRDVLYAWAGATTLDFAPLFFMVLLAIAYDRENERTSQPVRSVVGDVREMVRPNSPRVWPDPTA